MEDAPTGNLSRIEYSVSLNAFNKINALPLDQAEEPQTYPYL